MKIPTSQGRVVRISSPTNPLTNQCFFRSNWGLLLFSQKKWFQQKIREVSKFKATKKLRTQTLRLRRFRTKKKFKFRTCKKSNPLKERTKVFKKQTQDSRCAKSHDSNHFDFVKSRSPRHVEKWSLLANLWRTKPLGWRLWGCDGATVGSYVS